MVDRDATKRPIMGESGVVEHSDYVIFASRYPRVKILKWSEDDTNGLSGSNFEIEVDRQKAIIKGCNN